MQKAQQVGANTSLTVQNPSSFVRNHWTAHEQSKLDRAHAIVVGAGAVGSFALESLVRAGISHFTIIDGDVVEASNINRQLYALHSTIGMPKVDVARRRILDINPDARVEVINTFITSQNCPQHLSRFVGGNAHEHKAVDAHASPLNSAFQMTNILVDAIDSLDDKCALLAYALAEKLPVFSSMGAARKSRLDCIKTSDISKTSVCPLARAVRRKLARQGFRRGLTVVYSTEQPKALKDSDVQQPHRMTSLITVTASFGLYLSSLVLDYILAP